MNEAGLKRKFRMDAYVAKVKRLATLAVAGELKDATLDGVERPPTRTKTKAPTTSAKGSKKKTRTSPSSDDVAASMAVKRQKLDEFVASKKK
jgi:hypothetical protein